MNIRSKLSLLLGAGTLCLAALVAPASAAGVQPYIKQHADAAGTYTIDPDHSGVRFSVGHAGVALLDGAFTKIEGSYTFDPRHPQADKVDVIVQADSVTTFMPLRDKHLLGPEFLDAAKYPNIHFVGSRYVAQGEHRGVLHGLLTLHGITRPVSFHVRLVGAGAVPYLPKPWGGYLSGFVATAVIDRTAFGIDAYSSGIGHEVHLRVEVEAVRK